VKVVRNNSYCHAVAVTGGIGSGKSQVSRWLAQECNLPRYDADEEVGLLLNPGEQGWCRLRAELSPDYFGTDGSLLKAKLRQAIFADDSLRHLVEHEIHPLVLATLQVKISLAEGPCLVEVPLLYEVQWQNYFNCVLVVYAVQSRCRDRLMVRDGISQDQARAAICAQMSTLQKARRADYTVDNSRSWVRTLRQLEEIKKCWGRYSLEKKLDRHI
jgi:dephospho-CoA kinase